MKQSPKGQANLSSSTFRTRDGSWKSERERPSRSPTSQLSANLFHTQQGKSSFPKASNSAPETWGLAKPPPSPAATWPEKCQSPPQLCSPSQFILWRHLQAALGTPPAMKKHCCWHSASDFPVGELWALSHFCDLLSQQCWRLQSILEVRVGLWDVK